VSQTLRELPIHNVQTTKYAIGLVGESEFQAIAPVSVAFIDREFNFLAEPFQTKP
jgi:hypothetical protein